MTFATATEVLGELATLGPFFAVHAHGPGASADAPWRPVTELTTPSGALRGRIRVVQAALADQTGKDADDVELRVAASLAHLGLVARLAAPAVAVMAAGYHLDLRPDGLWWQDVIGSPVPLSVPESAIRARGHGTAAPAQLIDNVLAPLTTAVAELVPISHRVLWGNVASAVNGAAAQIAHQRPQIARQAWLTGLCHQRGQRARCRQRSTRVQGSSQGCRDHRQLVAARAAAYVCQPDVRLRGTRRRDRKTCGSFKLSHHRTCVPASD